MAKRLLRPARVFGPNGRLPIGRTKFYADFVATGLIRLVHLGPRAVAVIEAYRGGGGAKRAWGRSEQNDPTPILPVTIIARASDPPTLWHCLPSGVGKLDSGSAEP